MRMNLCVLVSYHAHIVCMRVCVFVAHADWERLYFQSRTPESQDTAGRRRRKDYRRSSRDGPKSAAVRSLSDSAVLRVATLTLRLKPTAISRASESRVAESRGLGTRRPKTYKNAPGITRCSGDAGKDVVVSLSSRQPSLSEYALSHAVVNLIAAAVMATGYQLRHPLLHHAHEASRATPY